MAILKDAIINGTLRCLNKIYAKDLDVSGATSFADMGVSGDLTVAGSAYFQKSTDLSGTANNKPAVIIGGTSTTQAHMEIDADEIQAKSGAAAVAPLCLNPDGGDVRIGNGSVWANSNGLNTSILTAMTGNITTLSSDHILADNVSVTNNLHAAHYDLQSVAQLGGSFYVSPTINLNNSDTKITFANSSTNGITMTIVDSSISDTMAGITWTAGSSVKISGKFGDVVSGTMEGKVVSIDKSNHRLTLGNITGGKATEIALKEYKSSLLSDVSVMVYQIRSDSNDLRVGIWMNCYDMANQSATIRIYGGTDNGGTFLPNVLLGNLSGIGTINGMTPTGWGLFAQNAFLRGTIQAVAGKIGGWIIDENHIMGGDVGFGADGGVYLIPTGSTTQKKIGGSDSTTTGWTITSGSHFGVTDDGTLYVDNIHASGGTIGGFDITDSAIKTHNVDVTSNVGNSVSLSSVNFTRTIGKVSRSNLRFAIGANFGVTGAGSLYSSSGVIGGWNITKDKLYNGTTSMSSTEKGIFLGIDNEKPGFRSYNGANQYVNITEGVVTAVGANIQGNIEAATGTIGGFTIDSNSIHTKNTESSNTKENAVWLSSSTFARKIGTTNQSKLKFAIGGNFAVNSDGKLFANGADLSGSITASGGEIGGFKIGSGTFTYDRGVPDEEGVLHTVENTVNTKYLGVNTDTLLTEKLYYTHYDDPFIANNKVYVGTNGISAGNGFVVTPEGLLRIYGPGYNGNVWDEEDGYEVPYGIQIQAKATYDGENLFSKITNITANDFQLLEHIDAESVHKYAYLTTDYFKMYYEDRSTATSSTDPSLGTQFEINTGMIGGVTLTNRLAGIAGQSKIFIGQEAYNKDCMIVEVKSKNGASVRIEPDVDGRVNVYSKGGRSGGLKVSQSGYNNFGLWDENKKAYVIYSDQYYVTHIPDVTISASAKSTDTATYSGNYVGIITNAGQDIYLTIPTNRVIVANSATATVSGVVLRQSGNYLATSSTSSSSATGVRVGSVSLRESGLYVGLTRYDSNNKKISFGGTNNDVVGVNMTLKVTFS